MSRVTPPSAGDHSTRQATLGIRAIRCEPSVVARAAATSLAALLISFGFLMCCFSSTPPEARGAILFGSCLLVLIVPYAVELADLPGAERVDASRVRRVLRLRGGARRVRWLVTNVGTYRITSGDDPRREGVLRGPDDGHSLFEASVVTRRPRWVIFAVLGLVWAASELLRHTAPGLSWAAAVPGLLVSATVLPGAWLLVWLRFARPARRVAGRSARRASVEDRVAPVREGRG